MQLPTGNGPCPTPALSCAWEFFGGGLTCPRPKLCQWFFQHFTSTDSHVPVSRHISWQWLKYQYEFTCNLLQGKAGAGGEIPPTQLPCFTLLWLTPACIISTGLVRHHTVSDDHSRSDGQQILRSLLPIFGHKSFPKSCM